MHSPFYYCVFTEFFIVCLERMLLIYRFLINTSSPCAPKISIFLASELVHAATVLSKKSIITI